MSISPEDPALAAVRAFLDGENTAGLATVDAAGVPHACNVWYARGRGLTLYFASGHDTRHARDIARSGLLALTVFAPTHKAAEIHGVQLRGRCVALEPESEPAVTALNVYLQRYPFIAASLTIRAALERDGLYRFIPTWVRWCDNRQKFGFKQEWELA